MPKFVMVIEADTACNATLVLGHMPETFNDTYRCELRPGHDGTHMANRTAAVNVAPGGPEPGSRVSYRMTWGPAHT